LNQKKRVNKAPSKSPAPPKKNQNLDMSVGEIEQTQQLLLHDQNYLKDKTVKKVSLATLKRRKELIDQKER